jgi:hypothetical protein
MPNNINDIIALVTIASPVRHRALSVYPLLLKVTSALVTYLVLDQALARGAFRITEVSEDGAVPRLLAINEGNSPVLLLDGEELRGAKQNRVLNLSVMIAPNTTAEIPVSCVESGRWHSATRECLSADAVQYCYGRAEKMSQVSQALHERKTPVSDQEAVWDHIAAKSSRMGVSSPTKAMAAMYESHREDLQDYLSAFPTLDDQVGAVYAIGNAIVGLDLFDCHTTYRRLAGKLTRSYALDAAEQSEDTEPPALSKIQSFVGAVRSADPERFAIIGMGETVRLSSDALVGAALEVEASCVHLSAFARQSDRDRGEDLSSIRTRSHRSRL